MEIELNEKLQLRIKNLLAQKQQIEQHLNNEINLILDVKEIDAEGKEIRLSEDFTKLIINE